MAELQKSQLKEINAGEKAGIDTSIYSDPKFNGRQMYQIRKGLEAELEVSVYLNEELTNHQMEQVRLGLEAGIPVDMVKLYAKPGFSVAQMEQIRLCMKYETALTEEEFPHSIMDCIRIAIRNGYDLSKYVDPTLGYEEIMAQNEEDVKDMLEEFGIMLEGIEDGIATVDIKEDEECVCCKHEAPTMKVEKKKGFFKRLFGKK